MKSKAERITILSIVVGMIICGTFSAVASAQTPTALFEKANNAYMKQEYDSAIVLYEKLLNTGKMASEVYFNLANSYYKNGNIAPSILNYERAQRLNPSDPDIAYNLRIANLSTIDKIEPAPMVFYEKWWNDFVYGGSVHDRAVTLLVLFWIALLLMAGYLFVRNSSIRKLLFFSSLVLIVLGAFTWYLSFLQNNHLNHHKGAVVFTESAYVKSSPDEKSANLFMLHSGTRVEVVDELHDWKKIRIANGNEGWIDKNAVELI